MSGRFSDCKECGHLTAYNGRKMRTARERLGLCPECCREKFKDHPGKPDPLLQMKGPVGYRQCPWSRKLIKIRGEL